MAVASDVLQSAFLKQVIARLDFSETLPFSEKSGPSSLLSAKLKKTFSHKSSEKKRNKQITVSPDAEPVEVAHDFTQWNFTAADKGKKLVISPMFATIEYMEYQGFESLREEFYALLDCLYKKHRTLSIQRFGLRYINQIEMDESNPTDWKKYLHANLLSGFKLADDKETISRHFNSLEFHYPDDTRMRFLYGMPNPDYPAAIRQKFFVLDFDASAQLVSSSQELMGHLESFHARIRGAFDQCVLPPLREKMKNA